MKPKFINPFSDYGFKAIFGREVSKELIIDFLNSVIHDEVIKDISFRNVEMLGVSQNFGRVAFDIFCENEKGEFFIVEMQNQRQRYFADRVLYYASFAIQEQARLMQEHRLQNEEITDKRWRYDLKRVYIICILNFKMENDHPGKYRWDVVRMDRELKTPFSETLNEIYLEMPKFTLSLSQCDTVYKKWLYVLNNIDIMERLPQELNNQVFQKLKSIVEIKKMTVEEYSIYEHSLAAERDLYACMETKMEEGELIGLKKGELKGIQKGRKEGELKGLKKGRTEEKRSIAISMKQQGISATVIAMCTGLSLQEIAAL